LQQEITVTATLGIGIGEEYLGYGPEVEYDVKREYSPDESSVELTSWFCSSAQCSPGVLSAVVMIAVSAKAVKLAQLHAARSED
jgi:hypothetical protein